MTEKMEDMGLVNQKKAGAIDEYKSFFGANNVLINLYRDGQKFPRDVILENITELEKIKNEGELSGENFRNIADEAIELLVPLADYFKINHAIKEKMDEIVDLIQENLAPNGKKIETLTKNFEIAYGKFVGFLRDDKNKDFFSSPDIVKVLDEFMDLINKFHEHEIILRGLRPKYENFFRVSSLLLETFNSEDENYKKELSRIIGVKLGNRIFDPEKIRSVNPEPINRTASRGMSGRES